MEIDCISDLHGHKPKLKGGDLLIVAGDLTARDELEEHMYFCSWLDKQKYKRKVVIAGNHDGNIQRDMIDSLRGCNYLEDSFTMFEGLKIYGSPWTKTFQNWNFMMEPDKLSEHWDYIPDDVDILVTHGPAYGLLDKVNNISRENVNGLAGCPGLRKRLDEICPKLFVCGHIHEGYGQTLLKNGNLHTKYVNASLMDDRYNPVNKPVRITL